MPLFNEVLQFIILILGYAWLAVTLGGLLYLLGYVVYLTYDLIKHTIK